MCWILESDLPETCDLTVRILAGDKAIRGVDTVVVIVSARTAR